MKKTWFVTIVVSAVFVSATVYFIQQLGTVYGSIVGGCVFLMAAVVFVAVREIRRPMASPRSPYCGERGQDYEDLQTQNQELQAEVERITGLFRSESLRTAREIGRLRAVLTTVHGQYETLQEQYDQTHPALEDWRSKLAQFEDLKTAHQAEMGELTTRLEVAEAAERASALIVADAQSRLGAEQDVSRALNHRVTDLEVMLEEARERQAEDKEFYEEQVEKLSEAFDELRDHKMALARKRHRSTLRALDLRNRVRSFMSLYATFDSAWQERLGELDAKKTKEHLESLKFQGQLRRVMHAAELWKQRAEELEVQLQELQSAASRSTEGGQDGTEEVTAVGSNPLNQGSR